MYYVYIIKSELDSTKIYVGYTINLEQRIDTHNSGGSTYTARYRPWNLIAYFCFMNAAVARGFESYLKSSAGKAFAQKRFW